MSPGLVQMLEADIEGLSFDDGVTQMGYLGDSQAPPLLAAAIQVVVQQPEVRKYLQDFGHYIARRGLGELKEAILGRPRPSSSWVSSALDPILDQVAEGALDELAKRSRPYVLGVAGLTGLAAFGLGALIGGARRGRACAKIQQQPK